MPNPSFQPLTLSVEEWQDCTQLGCECRQLNITNCLACRLKRECEAQAQAAADLRQRLDGQRQITLDMVYQRNEVKAQLEQAQKERDAAQAALVKLTADIPKAEKRLEQTAIKWRERASQAEAALEEMQKLVNRLKRGENCWCDVGIGNPMMRGEHSKICWELQRRRSAPGEEPMDNG